MADPGAVAPGLNDPTVVRPNSAGSSTRRHPSPLAGGPAVPLPHPGDRIDSFELEESIGVGGMGAVFRARDLQLDRHVALKILPPEQAGDPEVVQRFYQEGRAAARLDHENIARVYTIGHDERFHYISFEYIEGTTIRQRVERHGPLTVGEAINFTLQIASALVHACEREVVHRDIKPSNIIVTAQSRAKLVDMGLARRFERGVDDGLTQSGMTLGTFDYISPEQARDPRDVDVRSDLYSLGCTLFYMMTGRPPFPDGTVLQKLIQHQEEAPPDVRELNPAVPVDLAGILTKLMAKDRDRRYQTPEQLVRDLLIVAGAHGLRSVSPEGLVWMSAARPLTWERHLVWGIPAITFALVLLGLSWWGQEGGTLSPPAPPVTALKIRQAPAPKPAEAGVGETSSRAAAGAPARTDAPDSLPPAPAPRDLVVNSDADLLAVLNAAPARASIVLGDDGPYLLGRGPAPARLAQRDFTLKAGPGHRPILRTAREAGPSARSPTAVLDFLGGQITLEGLEFEIDPGDQDERTAIRTEGTELTLRRCLFRRSGPRGRPARSSALQLRAGATPPPGERPVAVLADSCHFDAGPVGVIVRGPIDLQLRDCTLVASDTAIWFANPQAAVAVPVSLRLRHDSILAGDGPVFRFEGTGARVWVDDSVIAPARDSEATLVATDRRDELDWRGRFNLYSKVGVFLKPTGPLAGRETVRDMTSWADASNLVRETGSALTQERVWEEPDPGQALARESRNPTRAFRVSRAPADSFDVGARQGPFGVLAPGLRLVATVADPPREKRPVLAANAGKPAPAASTPTTVPNPAPVLPPASLPAPPPLTRTQDMPEMVLMPPTDREVAPEPAPEKEVSPPKPDEERPAPLEKPRPPVRPLSKPSNEVVDPSVLRQADQFLEALRQPEARGGIVRIAADADWELPPLVIKPGVRWVLRGEPGPTRPRLRFRADPAAAKDPSAWSVLFEVQSSPLQPGSLQLEGIDLLLPKSEAARRGRSAAFGVWGGTDLSVTGCTVTVEGDRAASAVVVVEPGDPDANVAGVAPAAATVRLTDSFLRSGGELIEVAPGRQLDLDLTNAVVSTRGSLVRAHGQPKGREAEPLRLEIALRQVTARAAGGLAQLVSAADGPELPVAEVSARDSVLSTTDEGDPLFRVDGQDALATLRDRITWEGHRVAYHQINTYRLDQSSQLGAVPKSYDRASWSIAVGPKEADPVHGDLKFLNPWGPDRPAWTFGLDDARLAPDSPARSAGADLRRVPEPPSLEEPE